MLGQMQHRIGQPCAIKAYHIANYCFRAVEHFCPTTGESRVIAQPAIRG